MSDKPETGKTEDLKRFTEDSRDQYLTTNQGQRINDNQNSLKAGERGPSLLEDFILREKITHFDHERIPERVVHARGAAAHGYFQPYESLAKYTRAAFLQDPNKRTPVFVRFSTVAGSRGSTDLARDVRGFATKFYTDEGVFDLVGNNMPVFFIQDAIKFPDLIHAVKPEPHNEMPQAQSAHDTFWDFISLIPGVHAHDDVGHVGPGHPPQLPHDGRLWRAYLPLRQRPGRGVFHQVPLETAAGRPLRGLGRSCRRFPGNDPDFHRRDLWEAIEEGDYPEFELGVQIVPERGRAQVRLRPARSHQDHSRGRRAGDDIGKMVLNRNPENFFAETEQVAFHPGHVVPGIDFTNDPLLQGRLFSYTDTQLTRLGGPNFAEIPINRSAGAGAQQPA